MAINTKRKAVINLEAQEMARQVRKKFEIDEGPIRDIFALLESLKVLTARYPSEDPNLSGFFVLMGNKPCIYVNTNHPLGRQNFSAAHELCHWQFDCVSRNGVPSFSSDANSDEIEYRAESFAGSFLMPQELVLEYVREYLNKKEMYISYKDIIMFQHHFRVSFSAALTGLQKAKVITYPKWKQLKVLGHKENHEKLIELTEQCGLSTDLIISTPPVISKMFQNDIIDNYKNNRITWDKAAHLLSIYNISPDLLQGDC